MKIVLLFCLTVSFRERGFNCNLHVQPLAGKINPQGEDSAVCDPRFLAVADGVGGWGAKGIDSSLYSQKLINLIKEIYSFNLALYARHPAELIKAAWAANREQGSSTLVVATQVGNMLYSAKIGDSDVLILRRNAQGYTPVFKSVPQQHELDMPYQLQAGNDNRYFIQSHEHQVSPGDMVILGSDGLFDNLFVKTIVNLVNKNMGKSPLEIAQVLVKAAVWFSTQTIYPTPFSWNRELHGLKHTGGKPDDTTAVVAFIS